LVFWTSMSLRHSLTNLRVHPKQCLNGHSSWEMHTQILRSEITQET
jgi:hypothetical protein